jgi:hypothetical protein
VARVDVGRGDGPPMLEEEAQVRAQRGENRGEQSEHERKR